MEKVTEKSAMITGKIYSYTKKNNILISYILHGNF